MRQIDIARALNISVSTVSRVLNDVHKSASPALCNQIWQLARESKYDFDPSARALQSRSKSAETRHKAEGGREILCLDACLLESADLPSFERIVRGFEVEALKNAYSVVARESIATLSESQFALRFPEIKVYPLLVLGRIPQRLLGFFDNAHLKMVQVSLNVNQLPIDRVLCNGYSAASQIVQYLYFCGHRHIAYIGETKNELRYHGFRNQVTALGLPFEERNSLFECELSDSAAYRACDSFLSKRRSQQFCQKVSAIFCANDFAAVGVYKRLKEAGLKIPEDISIIGLDDLEQAQNLKPMLTTMRVPQYEMGRIAAQILFSRLASAHKLPLKVELPLQMVLRNSVRDFNGRSPAEHEAFRKALNKMIT